MIRIEPLAPPYDERITEDFAKLMLRAAFSEEQILEIVMLAGQYRGVSYLVNATGMELEEMALRFPSKD